MAQSEALYYPPQTSGPGWQQPCYAGPPQHQRPHLAPQNQNPTYPNQDLGPTSYSPQNECVQFAHQNQGPTYSQISSCTHENEANFCPSQHRRPSFPPQNHQCNLFPPQNQGPHFTPRNHGPLCLPQNQGSYFPTQSQGPMNRAPVLPPQNQDPHYPPQNQGPRFQPKIARPHFLPENQCPRFPPQNPGPRYHPQSQRPPLPPRNQGLQLHVQSPNQCQSQNYHPFLPPQNQGPQNLPYNQGSHCTTLNQEAPFPVQTQGPMVPPQNQGSQFPPQPQQQNSCCCPQINQTHVCPSRNYSPQCSSLMQGHSYQNQALLGPPRDPANQVAPYPVPNPGPPIPAQNLRPQLPPQNQRPMCHPLNQGPMCSPKNQLPICPPHAHPPIFPPENRRLGFLPRHQRPRFPPNNGPFHRPRNPGSRYVRPQRAIQQPDECSDKQYGGDESNNHHKGYGYDWSNQNEKYEDDWSNQDNNNCEDLINQNDDYEGWSIQRPNRSNKSTFNHRVPSRRNGFIETDCSNPPFKRLRVGPNKNCYESTPSISSSVKQCSNNIQVNILKLDLDSDLKQQSKQLDHLLNQSEQSRPIPPKNLLQNSKGRKKQDNFTKSAQIVSSGNSNENSSTKSYDQNQMKCQAKDKIERSKLIEKTTEAVSMDSSEHTALERLAQTKQKDICTQSIQRKLLDSNECSTDNKEDPSWKTNMAQNKDISSELRKMSVDSSSSNTLNNSPQSKLTSKVSTTNLVLEDKADPSSKSIQRKCDIKLNLNRLQNKDKSAQNSNKLPDMRGNVLKSYKQEPVAKIIQESDDRQPQVILNTSTKSAKQIKEYDKVNSKLNDADTSNTNNSLLQNNNESCLKSNKAQVKEKAHQNTKDSTHLNQVEMLTFNTDIKSQEISNLQREKLKTNKRLNSQADDSSAHSKKLKICDKPVSVSQKESPSNVIAVVENSQSKSEIQIRIEDVIIKTEYKKEVEHQFDDSALKDTACSQDHTLGPTNEIVVKDEETYFNATLWIKTETDNTTDTTNNGRFKENPESGNASNFASDGRSAGSIENVTNMEALENKLTNLSKNNCKARVQNLTNSTEMTSTTSERTCQEYFTRDDESQNSDLEANCQSLNDDSQNSSCVSGNGVNLLESNLREFDILDEVQGSEEEIDQSTISSEESDSEVSDHEAVDVDEEDIDAMLEEGLAINKKVTENKVTRKVRHKVILEEIGHNHFDLLPEGWIQVMHNSGMPAYLHQKSRVCAMARPYFLGPGSVRSHKIPLSAIPCLQYKRALEVEKKYEEENKAKHAEVSENTTENRPPLMPVISAKIETAEENEAAQSLHPSELQEYCKKVFSFKTISIIPFKTWGDRRKYGRITKDLKKQQRPLLPSGTKLLKFPIQNPDGTIAKSKGEWVINPNGKSYVCILHEYVQHALKQHPKYQFKELKNQSSPYSATVYIGEMQYGTGIGPSKKQSKLKAAKAALEVLIPEMKDKMENGNEFGINSGISKKQQNYENSIFDQIRIEDPRVAEFCAKTTEPPPYAILATCLQRNGMGLNEVKVEYNMNTKRHKEDEFKMTVKNHTATVMCKNKREGKQKAAQAILKALHPNIEYFGSLLRMYGNHSIKSVKEKKQEEQEITGLQCKAAVNQPNYAILKKLEAEMRKMAGKRKEQLAKGKFLCHNDLLLPTASTTDLNKIKL